MIFLKLYKSKVIVSMALIPFNTTLQDLMIQIDNYALKDLNGQDTFHLRKCLKNFKNKMSLRNSIDYLFTQDQFHKILHLLDQSVQSQSSSNHDNDIKYYGSYGVYHPNENKENKQPQNHENYQQLTPTSQVSKQNEFNDNSLNNQLLQLKKLLVDIFDLKCSKLSITQTLEFCQKCLQKDCEILINCNLQAKWAEHKKKNKPLIKSYKENKNSYEKSNPTMQLSLFLLQVEEITQKMYKISKDILSDLISISDVSCVNSKNTEKRSLLTEMLKESQQRNINAQFDKKSMAQSLNQYRIQCIKKSRSHRPILMQIEQKHSNFIRKKEIIPKKSNNCGACTQCIIF